MTEYDGRAIYIADMGLLLPYEATRKGRSTPLAWGKFRSPADRSETGLQYQMRRQAVLAAREGFAFIGIYDELLRHFGFDRTAALRGWLVNHDYQAASIEQIAQVIGCADRALLRRAIRALLNVGLLRIARRPDMERAIRDDRATCLEEPPPWKGDSARGTDGVRKPSGPRPLDVIHETGDGRQETGDVRDETLGGITPAASVAADGGEGKTAAEGRTGDDQAIGRGRLDDAEGPDAGGRRDGHEKPHPPGDTPASAAGKKRRAAQQPMEADPHPGPSEPDTAGKAKDGRRGGKETPGPGGSDRASKRAGGGIMGRSGGLEAMPDQVAAIIYATLYPDHEAEVIGARKGGDGGTPVTVDRFKRKECGAFASKWSEMLALNLPGLDLRGQYNRAVKEAAKIAAARGRVKKTRGAKWCHWMKHHCLALVREWANDKKSKKAREGS